MVFGFNFFMEVFVLRWFKVILVVLIVICSLNCRSWLLVSLKVCNSDII